MQYFSEGHIPLTLILRYAVSNNRVTSRYLNRTNTLETLCHVI